jgi:hypothetical protein
MPTEPVGLPLHDFTYRKASGDKRRPSTTAAVGQRLGLHESMRRFEQMRGYGMERETGIEPATNSLGSALQEGPRDICCVFQCPAVLVVPSFTCVFGVLLHRVCTNASRARCERLYPTLKAGPLMANPRRASLSEGDAQQTSEGRSTRHGQRASWGRRVSRNREHVVSALTEDLRAASDATATVEERLLTLEATLRTLTEAARRAAALIGAIERPSPVAA